jgi:hypothetical protein
MRDDRDAKPVRTGTGKRKSGLVLGLAVFEKISAVEGIHLTDEMRRDLASLERRGLSPEQRASSIADKYGRGST